MRQSFAMWNIGAVLLGSELSLAGSALALAQESVPAPVQAEIDENRKACEPDKSVLEPGFLTRKDVNGDGTEDFVLDYNKFTCGENATYFCGSAGCLTQVFVSTPSGRFVKVLDQNVEDIRFSRIKGRSAMLIESHGSACGRVGSARCHVTMLWTGTKFVAGR
jgi:hypothetical protein